MSKNPWREGEPQRKTGQTKTAEQRPETTEERLNAEWKSAGRRLALGRPLQNGSPKQGLKTVQWESQNKKRRQRWVSLNCRWKTKGTYRADETWSSLQFGGQHKSG